MTVRAVVMLTLTLTLAITPSPTVLFKGLLVALILGFAASLYPAWRASRQPLVEALNTA